MTYTLVAYRFGQTNSHQYLVAQASCEQRALMLAEQARDERSGKYGVAVYEWVSEGELSLKAYFPSMAGEGAPRENSRTEHYLSLGHWLVDAVQWGHIRVADPDELLPNVKVDVEIPSWIEDAVRDTLTQAYYCELLEKYPVPVCEDPSQFRAHREAHKETYAVLWKDAQHAAEESIRERRAWGEKPGRMQRPDTDS